jgi:hypothetical protein
VRRPPFLTLKPPPGAVASFPLSVATGTQHHVDSSRLGDRLSYFVLLRSGANGVRYFLYKRLHSIHPDPLQADGRPLSTFSLYPEITDHNHRNSINVNSDTNIIGRRLQLDITDV